MPFLKNVKKSLKFVETSIDIPVFSFFVHHSYLAVSLIVFFKRLPFQNDAEPEKESLLQSPPLATTGEQRKGTVRKRLSSPFLYLIVYYVFFSIQCTLKSFLICIIGFAFIFSCATSIPVLAICYHPRKSLFSCFS